MKIKKLIVLASTLCLIFALASCGGSGSSSSDGLSKAAEPWEEITIETVETVVPASDVSPELTILEKTQYCLSMFAMDKDGYYILFDGETLNGWRGYSRDTVPVNWTVDDGTIKIKGTGTGEAQSEEGGDLIFGHKFKNFELSVDWKVSKGGNSGIFYLAQEIEAKDDNGNWRLEPIYISAPEAQILDNENHPDGRLGKDGNRKSSSLYDMIPAKPQNANPYGEWNKTTILVYRGTVVHGQNDENVVEYHLWTQQWTDMLQTSKFSEEKWPLAFELLNNCGGPNREGYIGLQDHGDDIWFRNIRIKILD